MPDRSSVADTEIIGFSGRTLPDGDVCPMVGGTVSTSTVKLHPVEATLPLLSVTSTPTE